MSDASRFFCTQCERPVEFAYRRWHPNTRTIEYTVQCHGKEETIRMDKRTENHRWAGFPYRTFLTETP